MKSPTVFFLCCSFFTILNLFPLAANATEGITLTSPPTEGRRDLTMKNLNEFLFCQLIADRVITDKTQRVKIEFEYHDIFVNEQVLSYELIAKYQKIFTENGIQPGSQRQIHLEANGKLLIGDFGQYGQLIKETPINIPSEI